MTRDELLAKLKSLPGDDWEGEHFDADEALLAYINDDEITDAFHKLGRWYG